MTVRRDILRMDEPLPVDRVVFAIAPVDAHTGRIVRGPVTGRIPALGARARCNLSGMLVFVNLDAQAEYVVEIRAEPAGYFDVSETVPRPPDGASDIQRLRTVVLRRLPSAAFGGETTVVRGVVRLNGAPLDNAGVQAREQGLLPGPPTVFETRGDRRGAFALPLRLHPSNAGPGGPPSAVFDFTFQAEGQTDRVIPQSVTDGQAYRFGVPIEMSATATVSPLLLVASH
jgi:hypothetical protein